MRVVINSMTNDVLEQIVADYFTEKGYFAQHNISYRPKDFRQTPSDIDVIAVNPMEVGAARVAVINCKSWMAGVNITEILSAVTTIPEPKIRGGYMSERFREVVDPNWAQALREKVQGKTGQKEFIFYVSAVYFKGERDAWKNFPVFKSNLLGCELELVDLKEMIDFLWERLTTTPAHSELSRMLQLIKSAGGNIRWGNS